MIDLTPPEFNPIRHSTPWVWALGITNQTIPDSTWTKVTGWAVIPSTDPYGGWDTDGYIPQRTGIYQMTAQVAWENSAVGARQIRVVQGAFPVAAHAETGLGIDFQPLQVTVQPGADVLPADKITVEVWQNSGGDLDIVHDGIQAPSFMLGYLTGRNRPVFPE